MIRNKTLCLSLMDIAQDFQNLLQFIINLFMFAKFTFLKQGYTVKHFFQRIL